MKKGILFITGILFTGSWMSAQIRLPAQENQLAGLQSKQLGQLKHEMARPLSNAHFQWYPYPSPDLEVVTQASIAGEGSALYVHYRKPRPSLNLDEGIVEKWTGSDWAVQANLSNQCHEPDIDMDGSVVVTTWYDDSYDYGYGTNVNGNWVSLTGTCLVKQWFPRAAMAMGLPYMSFACKYSDGQATSYDMLHVKSLVGVGEQIELNGGWRVTFTSVGLRTHITGDDDAWYCVFSQQGFLYVMKGGIVNSQKEYIDLGDGFRMYNPVSHPEIALYQGNPVVGWFENANTELYIAGWDGSQWLVLGEGSIPTGSLYALRMSSSDDYLCVAYASTESDTAIAVNLYDGESWYDLPPVQNQFGSNIGTVDIAIHNGEPVVAFTEDNLLTIKKYTSNSITKTNPAISNPGSFTLHPNPAHDVIHLRIKSTGEYFIIISSPAGQVLRRQNFSGTNLQLDLSSLPQGTYFITLEGKEYRSTRRIVRY